MIKEIHIDRAVHFTGFNDLLFLAIDGFISDMKIL